MLDLSQPLPDHLLKQLELRLTMSVEDFRSLGDVKETPDGPVIHIDNGGSVLGVAHLDWVLWRKPSFSKDRHQVFCPQLDDRLGVWVILDLLPALYGIKYDVLLTDSEEVGKSTAKDFTESAKPYNWLFQFDRRGTDTVLYEYDSPDNRKRLEACGLTTSTGSYSDICYLSHLGVSGWNIGTGYYGEHSQACNAKLKETRENAHKFFRFFEAHKDTRIEAPPYTPPSYSFYTGSSRNTGWDWGDDYFGYYDSPTYQKEKQDILRAYNSPSRRYDEDWSCECGCLNHWDATYCNECGNWYDPEDGYDTDLDDEWECLVPPFDDEAEDFDQVSIDDWDTDEETFAQFCLRTGYQGKIIL